ncbi:hypothetical protein [Shewanella colwelliana]|uniref:hypothetical protein n=1 Tax=Shewanella colwelliana TaxID=23 RepID=UPI0037367543
MANIALVTLAQSHSAPTNTKAILIELGHSVTIYESHSVVTSQLVGFDLIAWCRGAESASASKQVADAVRAGVPLMCGTAGGTTVFNDLPIQKLGIISGTISQLSGDPSKESVKIMMNNNITTGVGNVGDLVSVYNSNTYMIGVSNSQFVQGVEFITADQVDDTRSTLAMVPKGTTNNLGEPTAASMAFIPWLYGVQGYTTNAKLMIQRLITRLIGEVKVVSGVVTDSNGLPAQLTVIAVDLTSNYVVGVTTSDIDGSYSMSLVIAVGGSIAVLCVDEKNNPLIYVG